MEKLKPQLEEIHKLLKNCEFVLIREISTQHKEHLFGWYPSLNKWLSQGKELIMSILKQQNYSKETQQFTQNEEPKQPQFSSADSQLDSMIEQMHFFSQSSELIEEKYLDFVHPVQSLQDCMHEYFSSKPIEQEDTDLFNKIKGYQRVRGDGNCCYTSIFYQYLQYLIQSDSQEEENKFMERIQSTNLEIFCSNKVILGSPHQQQLVKDYFVEKYHDLKRNNNLLDLFTIKNEKFYICSIIIFRNIVRDIYEKNYQEYQGYLDSDIFEELISWQKECNSNQVILSMIAKELNIEITVFYVNKLKVIVNEYNQGHQLLRINLLFRPGHYQIAIC